MDESRQWEPEHALVDDILDSELDWNAVGFYQDDTDDKGLIAVDPLTCSPKEESQLADERMEHFGGAAQQDQQISKPPKCKQRKQSLGSHRKPVKKVRDLLHLKDPNDPNNLGLKSKIVKAIKSKAFRDNFNKKHERVKRERDFLYAKCKEAFPTETDQWLANLSDDQ